MIIRNDIVLLVLEISSVFILNLIMTDNNNFQCGNYIAIISKVSKTYRINCKLEDHALGLF